MLGIEPRTSYMQSMCSTTELHPHCESVWVCVVCLVLQYTNTRLKTYQDFLNWNVTLRTCIRTRRWFSNCCICWGNNLFGNPVHTDTQALRKGTEEAVRDSPSHQEQHPAGPLKPSVYTLSVQLYICAVARHLIHRVRLQRYLHTQLHDGIKQPKQDTPPLSAQDSLWETRLSSEMFTPSGAKLSPIKRLVQLKTNKIYA